MRRDYNTDAEWYASFRVLVGMRTPTRWERVRWWVRDLMRGAVAVWRG